MHKIMCATLGAIASVTVACAAESEEVGFDVESLTAKWGKPGRLSFEKGETGFPVAVISSTGGVAKVSMLGGNLFSYIPAGQEEVLYRPSKMPFVENGKEFVHGGIPICWPWFNCFDFAGRDIHGIARYSRFEIRKVQMNRWMTEVRFALVMPPEMHTIWPFDADLEYDVRVSSRLDVTLRTRNTGTATFVLTEGLHAYFYVGDLEQSELHGFKNSIQERFTPDMPMRRFGEDVIKLTPCEGRVFMGMPRDMKIVDNAMKRTIVVGSYGKRCIILWNYKPEDPTKVMENLEADSWKNFICVEPSTIPREYGIPIPPGRCHELQLSVESIKNVE